MTGFEAIAHHNGWVMAGAGALIVFLGLAALAFSISLLPKVLALFEKRVPPAQEPAPAEAAEAAPGPALFPTDIREIARHYERLVLQLGEPFQLAALYTLSRELDLPHPHLSLSALQRAGVLLPQGDGAFTWNNEPPETQEG